MQLDQEVTEHYVALLHKKGEEELYNYIIELGIIHNGKFPNPEIEVLEFSDAFFALYRSTGKDVYFDLGRIFRRSAHKLYREFLKTNKEKEFNAKFLNRIR